MVLVYCRTAKQQPTGGLDFDVAINRLTRSLSAPRRCNNCHKMVFLTALRCKECGNVTHESCANDCGHQCPPSGGDIPPLRRRSYQPKLLESTGESPTSPVPSSGDDCVFADGSTGRASGSSPPSAPATSVVPEEEAVRSSSAAALTLSGLLKVVHWLSQKRRSREFSRANAADMHVRGRFGLPQDPFDEKMARKRLKSLLKNAHKQQQQRGVSEAGSCVRRPTLSTSSAPPQLSRSSHCALLSPNGSLSSSASSSAAQTPSDTEPDGPRPGHHRPGSGWSSRTVSEVTSSHHSTSSAVSSGVFRCSPVPTRNAAPGRPPAPPPSQPTSTSVGTASGTRRHQQETTTGRGNSTRPPLSIHGRFGRHYLSKARTLSVETKGQGSDSLCCTWPPAGRENAVSTFEDLVEDPENRMGELDTFEENGSCCDSVKETLGEWCIPYRDLEFNECIRRGRNGDVYRGRWHGEVLIYTFQQHKECEVQQFLEEVAQMSMIRHENILLFMGACVEPPKLAIITSMKKGPSLYEQIHVKRHRLPLHTKINIARQVAQGMGYLHAKGILHRHLTSKNVILESRVKLCIMDQGLLLECPQEHRGYGCLPRGQLAYLSPELMRSLQVELNRIFPVAPHTQETDVYAFGSLLYEILAERFPFQQQPPHAIIWQVAQGHHAVVDDLKCTTGLRTLLLECWEQNPSHRPTFSYISRQLQENVSLHRRHSSSEPEGLNRAGLPISITLCA